MDERLRCVSPLSNFNANPLNLFNPHMHGWVEPIGSRQPDLLALQAIRVPEKGQLVREQMAQALRVSEQAEQKVRVSLAFEKEVFSRSARRNKHTPLFQEALMERRASM